MLLSELVWNPFSNDNAAAPDSLKTSKNKGNIDDFGWHRVLEGVP
jgi:hypothetical protein